MELSREFKGDEEAMGISYKIRAGETLLETLERIEKESYVTITLPAAKYELELTWTAWWIYTRKLFAHKAKEIKQWLVKLVSGK